MLEIERKAQAKLFTSLGRKKIIHAEDPESQATLAVIKHVRELLQASTAMKARTYNLIFLTL